MSDDEKIPVPMSPSDNQLVSFDELPKRRGLDVELINAPIRAVQPHLAVGVSFDTFRNEVGPPLNLPPRMVSGQRVHEQALSTRSNAEMLIGMKTAREFLRSVFRGEYRATSEQASKMIGVLQGLLTKNKDPDRKVLKLAAATSLFDPEMDAALVGINACEPVPSDVHVIALASQSLLRKQVFELTIAELADECRRIHKLIDRRASAFWTFMCELADEDWRLFSQDREEWFERHKANGFRLAPFFDDWSVNVGYHYGCPELKRSFEIEQDLRTAIIRELAERYHSGKPVEMPPDLIAELEDCKREREAFLKARQERSKREHEERERRRQREEREREEREREEHKQAIERQVLKREVERSNREYLDNYWADIWAEQRDEDERFERLFEKN